jgi:hypothetical protein
LYNLFLYKVAFKAYSNKKSTMASYKAAEDGAYDDSNVDNLLALGGNEFRVAFGEDIEQILDINTMRPGEDLAEMYWALERQVADAVEQGGRIRKRIRDVLFPSVFTHPSAPENAGNYQIDVSTIERIHRDLLFNGNVEACDGTCLVHDTLPITIVLTGAALVSYNGNQGAWLQQLFRRDLRIGGFDPIAEAMALIERRRLRDSTDASSTRDRLSDFTQRGLMSYTERAVLLHKAKAPWRMGHGHPVPHELLTGGGLVINGDMPLLTQSIDIWHKLLAEHKKWVFVTSAPADRVLLTLGDALYPLEFALVKTPLESMRNTVNGSPRRGLRARAQAFVEEVGPQIVIGLYRASAQAPARLFYAHRDYAHLAAIIAIADSVLQEHRGFPMLIDLADMICRITFGSETFNAMVQQAYTEAGAPFRYLRERETRQSKG